MNAVPTVPADAGRFVPPAIADDWLLWLAGLRSKNTARAYGSDFAQFFDWATEQRDIDICQLTRSALERYRNHLTRTVGRAPTSVNRKVAAVRSWHNWRVDNRGATPMAGLRSLPTPSLSDTRWLNDDESVVFMAEANQRPAPQRALVWLLMHGLRRAEALGAKWGHLRDQGDYYTLTVINGKGGHTRTFRVAPHLVSACAEAAGPERTPHTFICHQPGGMPYSLQWANDVCASIAKAAGMDRVSPHMLRHTFAVAMLRKKAGIRDVQRALGHHDPRTTEVYLHGLETWADSPVEEVSESWLTGTPTKNPPSTDSAPKSSG